MNSPVDVVLRDVSLDDKYSSEAGAAYLTGTQALVRLPMMQRRRDLAAGHNTAGYISGYRGSPIGGYDQALWKATKRLDEHHVRFVPGLNEDLAATAIWGTQQLPCLPGARYDGVFSIWYGKGPGVDRSGDAFRHANQAGTSALGGVIAIAGDDHGAKSSTVAAQTDHIFIAVSMPVLAPATVQDYLDLGLHGFAMSRFSGLWVGFKSVTDSLEAAGIVDASDDRVRVVLPDRFEMPPGGLNSRWPEEPFLKLEERLARWKLPAARAYARVNRLDRTVFGRAEGEPARLGIVSTGKSWLDTMQALADLGIDHATANRLGLRVYKVAMPWPLEPEGIAEFCAGCSEVLVIEEKRALVESQIKEILYDAPERPMICGKTDPSGRPLVPEGGELSPALLARIIAGRLGSVDPKTGRGDLIEPGLADRISARMRQIDQVEGRSSKAVLSIERIPYFCSGCPHNTSTQVPEGSRANAGIGCHYMAQWMDRRTDTFTQMGGEGMTWVGQAPFSSTPHVFQNIGDGTYFHSGSLAIRHAVATRTPITYKILFNDAVAMTGGQRHDGQLTPDRIVRQMLAEGVERVEVVTDEPDKYPKGYFPSGISVHHRSELDAVQRSLREYQGVSVLVYDQTCAAEKRRRRKRGAYPDPDRRAFINEAVCEGCGDCGVKSNCVSIEPVETEFGRKRMINQSSCNKDFSCVNGFCPSFVTLEGAKPRKRLQGRVDPSTVPFELPAVDLPRIGEAYSILITGIGGTGVVTIGQLLGMAAHLEGKGVTVLDMAGLAQKNGAVMSFVRIAHDPQSLHAPRIGLAAADAVLGCDVVVTASKDALPRMLSGRTRAAVNVAPTPTADFTRDANWQFPLGRMEQAIVDAVGAEAVQFIDATRLATGLLGDAITVNLFMLGYAWQQGLIPLSARAIERAIELNEVSIETNKAAFLWGRRAAVDPDRVSRLATPAETIPVSRQPSRTLDELIARRADFLSDYQDDAWADRYRTFVDRVRDAEERVLGAVRRADEPLGRLQLTEAVARNLAKLMSYKDEYEVARLYASGDFMRRVADQFEGDIRLHFHLAPPLLARRNERGELIKRRYGSWMMHAFKLLSRLKGLRGSAFDPFGYTQERRTERRLIADYERRLSELIAQLDAPRLPLAVELARVPESIRGFGHVKDKSLEDAQRRIRELLERFSEGEGQAQSTMPARPISRTAASQTAAH
jgi:indolepyruvate ferredoxin oxidoreductase